MIKVQSLFEATSDHEVTEIRRLKTPWFVKKLKPIFYKRHTQDMILTHGNVMLLPITIVTWETTRSLWSIFKSKEAKALITVSLEDAIVAYVENRVWIIL